MKKFKLVTNPLLIGLCFIMILGSFKSFDRGYSASSYAISLPEMDDIKELSKRIEVDAFIDNKYIDDDESNGDSKIIYADDTNGSSYFSVSEFTKYDKNPSRETVRKIKEIHIPQLTKVRNSICMPIIIRSSSRTYDWEIERGRSGNSKHVYKEGNGAVDISVRDYSKKKLDTLENALIDETLYNRITRYDTFIHVDFGKNRFGGRAYYKNTKQGWIYIGIIK
jgi:hypothetical protein